MKHKLFLILICLLGISNVDAQFNAPVERNPQVKFKASPVKFSGQQLRAATAGSLYFGYCDENASPYGVGAGSVAEISAAICMPASISGLYAGKTITTIRIGLTANCTNVSVWIRSSLSGANLISKTVGNANSGWLEVTLSNPYTITASDLYIGYTATGNTQIGFSGQADYNACWLYSDQVDSQWLNVGGNGFGSLCIQAGIDVKGATILAVKPESLPKSIQGSPNQNISVPCSIKSYSSVDITSVKVSYQIDNQTSVEQTFQTSIAPMKSGSINIPVKAIAANGLYNFSIKIPEINGQSNTFANESLNTQIRVLSHSFPQKVVMEEGTGTWCGWCIRGAVGMAMMKEKYPDSFIGIAVHDGDPMTLMAYDNFMTSNFINGFPSAVINRKTVCDPYPDFGAEDAYQAEIAKKPIAGIQLSGGFTDANKKIISLKTETTFGFSLKNANFKLAYVLIEDGVTGYEQANYYSGGGSGAMGGYENKPNPVKDMVFNDVARGIYSDPTGISGSIPASVTEMTPVENTYTINLPNAIQNKDQLAVAVMLINGATGEIENADIIGIAIIGQNIPVTGVKLNQTAATLLPGNTLQLSATVSPVYATNKKVTWSSSNQTVASVDATGKVTALAKGTATITVTTEDGNKTATCEVKVIAAPCDNPTASGTTGDLAWMLCPDGTLTIIGQGKMPDYNYIGGSDADYSIIPWFNVRNNIKTVVIQSGVTHIGSCSFIGGSFTSVSIPNTVTSIGDYAFAYFSSPTLTSINIPESVISIGESAFNACGLTGMIDIPSSVMYIGSLAFWQNFLLTDINVDTENVSYSSVDGILYNKIQDTLISCPCGKAGTVNISKSVITIGPSAFNFCFNVDSIVMPPNVKTISFAAFWGCNITSLTIPSLVTTIEYEAIGACRLLTKLINKATTPQAIEAGVFDLTNISKISLVVPTGSKALYEAAKVWKDFGSIIEVKPTGIVLPPAFSAANVYVSNQNLSIESNASETIDIYSLNGIKVYTSTKPQGIITVSCGNFPEGILIVKGSSGWVRKVIN